LLVALAVVGFAAFGLTGCGGSSLFDMAGNTTQEPTPPPKAVAEAPIARVALNAIVGPPDPLGKQLHQEFAAALERENVAVAAAGDHNADFHLRPYILAAKEKNGTKVSYVLDVSDSGGKRLNRFTGEEMLPGNASRDPWAALTPTAVQSVAAKATGAFAGWVPHANPNVAANTAGPPPSAGSPKAEAKADTPRSPRPAAKQTVAAAPPPSPETTGSIDRPGAMSALVPTVSGAPGDGSTSLTAAIKRELQAKGVPLADRPGGGAYRVEGAVTLGEPKEGKQAIQIEWVVKDPQGKRLGTVSQKNDIPEGSLDGAWGKTADQAAGAAVQGIFKLLPGANKAIN
jgi:hypothetical protein